MPIGRKIWRGIGMTVLVLPTALLGTLLALGWTSPGRQFLSRLIEQLITASVAGSVSIGAIDGNLIDHLVLEQFAIRDSLGAPVIIAARVEARYDPMRLYRGELTFHDVLIDSGTIHLVRGHEELWNYQRVFRAKAGTDTLPPPLLELRRVTLHHMSLRVDLGTTPESPAPPILRHATPPARPRIEPGANGPLRVRTLDDLNAGFSLIRISDPKREPILLEIDSLSTTLSDPSLTIRAMRGQILQAGDSLRFTLTRVALPGTVMHGSGAVRWPLGPLLMDFALTADTVDLKDLRWISPDFPDWQGRGHVVAISQSGTHASFKLEQLHLGSGPASAAGSMTAITDSARGLGFQDLNLSLANVPLSLARPYLDTLPFAGTLTGRLIADGFMDAMHLGGDLIFADALVTGQPRSHLVMDGVIHFGGAEGANFDEFRVEESSIDLGSVRRMVPAMVVQGSLALAGRLDGPWTNVKFNGITEHIAPDQSRSRLVGAVGLDTRDSLLAVDIDGNFDQLSFDALRSGYPQIKARGGLTGHFAARGRIDSLTLDVALSGDIGTIHAAGNLRAAAPNYGTDSLVLDFTRINADALLGEWGSTAFNGNALLRGRVDSSGTPRGTMTMTVDPSRIGEFSFEGAQVQLHADSGLVSIDTLQAELPEGWVDVRGSLGMDSTHAGTLSIDAGFRSLTPFDSIIRSRFGIERDSVAPKALNGTVHGTFTVTGSLANYSVDGVFQARQLVLDQWHVVGIAADVRADSMGRRGLDVTIEGDSLGHTDQLLERFKLGLAGRLDSLRFAIDGQMYRSKFGALGTWRQADSNGTGRLDSLAINNPQQHWRLSAPVAIAWADGRPVLPDTALFQTVSGDGQLKIAGSVPGAMPGDLSVSAVGLNVHELVSAIQHDSSTYGGIASLDFRLGGVATAPTLLGSVAVTGPTIDDVHIPMVRATFDYRDQRLRSQVTFYRTGDPLLLADLSLPLNLAFSADSDRKLPGAIDITAKVDSADLSLLEAFTTSVRRSYGAMSLNMHATGSWKAPRFDGLVLIHGGGVLLPDLNVEYRDIIGRLRFTENSLVADTLEMRSGGGRLAVHPGGFVRFEQLTTPILGFDVDADNFLLMDVPSYLTARPTGSVSLRGPVLRPVMNGRLSLSQSVFYFADLVDKTLIDIDDPMYAGLVDTSTVRRQGLGASFQNRFLDSLRIDNLTFSLGNDDWLRSTEANVQLTSAGDVSVTKHGKLYNIEGGFTAARGTYTLPGVGKVFDIQRGNIQYQGTSDLNATLDLEAKTTVHAVDGSDIPIVIAITGTIKAPKVTPSSPGRILSQRDLYSYLATNQPASEAVGGVQTRLITQTGFSLFTNEFNRSLSKTLGFGLELQGFYPGSNLFGSTISKPLGGTAFFSLNAGYCRTTNSYTLGASLEYLLGRGLRVQGSLEPIQSCLNNYTSDLLRTPTRYQYGGDLFWKREY